MTTERAPELKAFDALKPLLRDVSRVVAECPIDQREMAVLTVLVAAHFLGAACGAIQKGMPQQFGGLPEHDIARHVAAEICDRLERAGAPLQ